MQRITGVNGYGEWDGKRRRIEEGERYESDGIRTSGKRKRKKNGMEIDGELTRERDTKDTG
jgi:hypothetical protein